MSHNTAELYTRMRIFRQLHDAFHTPHSARPDLAGFCGARSKEHRVGKCLASTLAGVGLHMQAVWCRQGRRQLTKKIRKTSTVRAVPPTSATSMPVIMASFFIMWYGVPFPIVVVIAPAVGTGWRIGHWSTPEGLVVVFIVPVLIPVLEVADAPARLHPPAAAGGAIGSDPHCAHLPCAASVRPWCRFQNMSPARRRKVLPPALA